MSLGTIYIDVNTGVAQRADGSALPPFRFFERDILSLGIEFVSGATPVTATVLAGPAVMRLGIKQLGAGGVLLASCVTYTLVGNVAACVLSLNTNELIAYLATSIAGNAREAQFLFEIEVTSADGSVCQTYHQSVCTVTKDVNVLGDLTPTPAVADLYVLKSALFDANGRAVSPYYVGFRGELATAADVRAMATAGCAVPYVFDASFSDDDRRYKVRTRVAETDDGNFVLIPNDYNAGTNNVVILRIR